MGCTRYPRIVPIDDPSWRRADQWLAEAATEEAPDLIVAGVPTAVGSLSASQGHLTPAAWRMAMGRFATFDGERSVDIDGLVVSDQGDFGVEGLDLGEALHRIEVEAASLRSASCFGFIGGDNAITRPLVKGLAGGSLGGVGVITLDAHHDVRTLDRGPTNGTPMRGLIEDGLGPGRVAQVGIAGFANSAPYRQFCDTHGFTVVTMADVETWGIEEAMGVALDAVAGESDWLFLDVDVDVLDRVLAPGCPGARPGGMSTRQLATATWLAGLHPKVRAADFVEVDPSIDVGGVTVDALTRAFLGFAAGLTRRLGRG
jgi:arginase family enzyme